MGSHKLSVLSVACLYSAIMKFTILLFPETVTPAWILASCKVWAGVVGSLERSLILFWRVPSGLRTKDKTWARIYKGKCHGLVCLNTYQRNSGTLGALSTRSAPCGRVCGDDLRESRVGFTMMEQTCTKYMGLTVPWSLQESKGSYYVLKESHWRCLLLFLLLRELWIWSNNNKSQILELPVSFNIRSSSLSTGGGNWWGTEEGLPLAQKADP